MDLSAVLTLEAHFLRSGHVNVSEKRIVLMRYLPGEAAFYGVDFGGLHVAAGEGDGAAAGVRQARQNDRLHHQPLNARSIEGRPHGIH